VGRTKTDPVAHLRRRAKALGLRPWAVIDRSDGHRGRPLRADLQMMIEAAEMRAAWCAVFAAEEPSSEHRLFLVRAIARFTGRSLSNPQCPYSEPKAVEILRPLCGEGTLEELARWMARARPGDSRQTETKQAHIAINCCSPADIGLIPQIKGTM
jgi:hypothetical protein